jgi:HlyD family secretion protein
VKKTLVAIVIIAAGAGSGYAYYRHRQTAPVPTVATAAVTRGDIVDTVGATGTLQAVTTVQVGTQVSGTIQSLNADFNSLVKKGQVIARLDPSLFQTQIEQARANLLRAQADVERLRVALDDARVKLTRARGLSERQLLPQSDLDAADVAVRSAEAQLRSSEAQVTQARAALNQNQVNLDHTVIEAPIDGLVISRNVDVGQTVAASMQAPTLFVLAADLTKMQVVANLDESDVGRIRPGQEVAFRVDAYPNDDFHGKVSQVRLNPLVQQNVVTYATVIDVPNNELKLKPGMTANVNIEIARRTNVLRIPNSALRFRPTPEMYTALGLNPPERGLRGEAAADGRRGGASEGKEPAKPGVESTGSDPLSGNDTKAKGNVEEQRGELLKRMRDRGIDPGASGGRRGGRGGGRGSATPPSLPATRATGATTIDALFGPLPLVETSGRVWQYTDKQLEPIRLRLGITDGQATELIEGSVTEGDLVVTNISLGGDTRPAATGGFPFGQPGRGQFPGGFPGGGNRGGGGNQGRGR